ncbi:MAG: hypothetical protein EBZ52_01705 [Actinobacteria bacterium]|nr:hypothetical protein [Actinomycetota bacterium]
MKLETKLVGVIGSGIMGSGIAEVVAKSGIDVVVRSRSQQTADATKSAIENSLKKQLAKSKITQEQLDALVFVDKMQLGLTTLSSAANNSFLVARSSATDSMIKSQFAKSSSLSVTHTWAIAASSCSCVIFALATCFLRLFSIAVLVASAVCWLRERTTTSIPDLATTSAMPEP